MALTLSPALLLIALLGHPRFAVREAAHVAAAPLVNLSPSLFLHHEQHNPDVEIQRRCKALVDGWYERNADRLSRGYGTLPWIACTAEVSGEMMCDLLDVARKTHESGSPTWLGYREATRLLLVRYIAARLPVETLLRDLWEAEAQWKKETNWRP